MDGDLSVTIVTENISLLWSWLLLQVLPRDSAAVDSPSIPSAIICTSLLQTQPELDEETKSFITQLPSLIYTGTIATGW
jgi:hypothetical protein